MDRAFQTFLVFAATMIGASSGIYGIMSSRTLIRLLVSIELLFNSVIMASAYIGTIVGADPGFYSLLLATIVLTIAEIAIVAAILVLVYKTRRSLRTDLLREVKG